MEKAARDVDQCGTLDTIEWKSKIDEVFEEFETLEACEALANLARVMSDLDRLAKVFLTTAQSISPGVRWKIEFQPHYSAIVVKPNIPGKTEADKAAARVLRANIGSMLTTLPKPEDTKIFMEYPGLPIGY